MHQRIGMQAFHRCRDAAQGAPVVSIATIDATGTDAVIVNPDSGIKTFKDLEGKKVLTTAGAGVNTLFPVAAQNAGADVRYIELGIVSAGPPPEPTPPMPSHDCTWVYQSQLPWRSCVW